MNQFIAGIIIFLIPGLLPAYVQYKNNEKGSRLLLAVNALTNAFLILVCTYGYLYLLFGDVVFPIVPNKSIQTFQNHYILLYAACFVGAYGFSFLLTFLTVCRQQKQFFQDKKNLPILMITALWSVLFAAMGYDDYAGKHIVINEVCSHNLSLILDDRGENSDYIELYNPSLTTVSLEGWYLSDNENVWNTTSLSGLYMEPRSYLVLFADGTAGSKTVSAGEEGTAVYLDFRLDEQGETLILADEKGCTIDRVEIPSLTTDVSYARLRDGRNKWSVVKGGSPGKSNKNLMAYVIPTLEQPVFSVQSGFYEEPFELTLTVGENEKIYYTLDGSEPTTESALYSEPLIIQDNSMTANHYANIEGIAKDGDYSPVSPIDKGTVVKAVCVNEAGESSDIVSQVYFVGLDDRSGYDNVKVMSVVGNPADFFSQDRGIYVLGEAYKNWEEYGYSMGYSFSANYTHTDKTGERAVTITLFDEDKDLIAQEKIGVRIRGGASKGLRQKGFNFYARSEYGEDVLELCRKMLRTSGSIDTNRTMLRDVFNQSLVADRALDIQPGEPCVMFLNGEYWGLYNLQTRFTEEYFENQYGISEDDLILIKQDRRVAIGEEKDMDLYTELVTYAQENDLSRDEHYAAISRMMDVQSFIDHYCFEIYIGNTDWPLNNVCCWRTRETDGTSEYADGRWRWGIYDTDESTGIYPEGMSTYSSNAFLEEAHWFGSPTTTPLMSNLLDNAEFKKRFVLTFMDMVNENFEYRKVHDQLYELAAVYEEPMVETYHRFNGEEYTTDTFYENIERIDEFYRYRSRYIVPYMAEAMELSGSLENVTLQATDGGSIILNTIEPDLSSGEWNGSYYTDYPLRVTAVVKDGYRFVGWQGSCEGTQETIEVPVTEGGIAIKAVFEPANGG